MAVRPRTHTSVGRRDGTSTGFRLDLTTVGNHADLPAGFAQIKSWGGLRGKLMGVRQDFVAAIKAIITLFVSAGRWIIRRLHYIVIIGAIAVVLLFYPVLCGPLGLPCPAFSPGPQTASLLQFPETPISGPVHLPAAGTPEWWGKFTPERPAITRAGDDSYVIYLEDLEFRDSKQETWSVPRGYRSDGASIPSGLWFIIGHPLTGSFWTPSAVHDFYCCMQNRPWERVHMVFYEGLLANRVEVVRAMTMWGAVRFFGPKWHIIEEERQECMPVELPTMDPGDIEWFRGFATWVEAVGQELPIERMEELARGCDAIALEDYDLARSAFFNADRPDDDKVAAQFISEVGCPAGEHRSC
jgi:hypothetical protein